MDTQMKKRLSNKIDKVATAIALGVIFFLICKRNQDTTPVASGVDTEDENLGEITDYIKKRTPKGELYARTLTVTEEQVEVNFSPYPLQSLVIINDGSNTVYLRLNDALGPQKAINGGETNTIDYEVPTIEEAYLSCSTGDTSAVRLECIY